MKSYIKNNLLGLLGLLFGIIGILIAIVFYQKSKIYSEPIFIEEPNRTIIVDSSKIADSPLILMKKDSIVIQDNVTAVKFYFWNQGNKPIKSENILKEILLKSQNPEVEILECHILKVSRTIVNPKISLVSNTIKIDFQILEYKDGFIIQVVYIGDPSSKFSVDGIIEGVKEFKTYDSVVKKTFWQIVRKKFITLLIFLIILIIIIFGVVNIGEYISSDKAPRILKKMSTTIKIIFYLALICMMLYAIISEPIKNSKDEAKSKIIDNIPEKLQ